MTCVNQLSFRDIKYQAYTIPERIIYWTIVLTPLCWILGLQTIIYPSVVIGLFIFNFRWQYLIRKNIPKVVWTWLLMAIVALWTNLFGLAEVNFDLIQVAATLFTLYKGYLMIFAAIALPFFCCIRLPVIVRAVSWLAAGCLVTLVVQMAILFMYGEMEPLVSPLARLIPGDKLSLLVKFAVFQPFFGIPLPRTELYTADPPILGVFALICGLICWDERKFNLRRWALLGCGASLLISQSRLAWVCLPLIFMIIAGLRSNLARHAGLWLATLLSLFSGIFSLTIGDLMKIPMTIFNRARADSSRDREYVIEQTMNAWQESPWLGWGIVRGHASWGNNEYSLPLGTFSSYSQVLYLHGAIGFIIFILTLFATLINFWQPAAKGDNLSQRAFAGLIALYLLIHATNLTWMAVYIWFFFVWLGVILANFQCQSESNLTWEDLGSI